MEVLTIGDYLDPIKLPEGFRVDNSWRYLLYLSTVIFLASLFFDAKVTDISYFRGSALVTIVYCLIIWAGYDLVNASTRINSSSGNWLRDITIVTILLTTGWLAVLIWFPIRI